MSDEQQPLVAPSQPPRFQQNAATWEGLGDDPSSYRYGEDWWRSFDLLFLLFMCAYLLVICLLTHFFHPGLFYEPQFYWPLWLANVLKVLLEWLTGFFGGLLVVRRGVKVNYTRKIQHAFAYLFPLLSATFLPSPASLGSHHRLSIAEIVIGHVWGYWFVLLAFLVLIYPVRTRVRPVFIAFACLDRPEDRPYTLKWIVTQICLGYVVIETFKWYMLYAQLDTVQHLIYVIVLTVGVGDGLAEPVGIRFGTLKYRTRACCSKRKFTRSVQGSACVFLTGLITVLAFFNSWDNYVQVVVAAVTFPILMALAEAVAPHTWDTPVLMLVGALAVFGISFIPKDLPVSDPTAALWICLAVGIGGGLLVLAFIVALITYIKRHPIIKATALN